jgi:hypothetical protein
VTFAEDSLEALDCTKISILDGEHYLVLRGKVREVLIRELKPLVNKAVADMAVNSFAGGEVVTYPAALVRKHQVTARELGISEPQFTALISMY